MMNPSFEMTVLQASVDAMRNRYDALLLLGYLASIITLGFMSVLVLMFGKLEDRFRYLISAIIVADDAQCMPVDENDDVVEEKEEDEEEEPTTDDVNTSAVAEAEYAQKPTKRRCAGSRAEAPFGLTGTTLSAIAGNWSLVSGSPSSVPVVATACSS
jgi:hypothetical protein